MAKRTVKGGTPKRQEFYYEKVARENARRFIDESPMSQRAVAKELGMNHYQELNNMLRGSTTILNQIPALARVLKKSECDFFKDPSEQDKPCPAVTHRALFSLFADVMDSNDEGTKKALAQNIEMFAEKIKKEAELLARIEKLEKRIGEDPPSDSSPSGRRVRGFPIHKKPKNSSTF